jgi:hypothetical protein
MAAKRMTGKDYKKEYEDLYVSLGVIEKRIQIRLLTLCKRHPNIPLYTNPSWSVVAPDVVIKTGDIIVKGIAIYDTDKCLDFIEIIEKHLADQHPHKQTTIEFK